MRKSESDWQDALDEQYPGWNDECGATPSADERGELIREFDDLPLGYPVEWDSILTTGPYVARGTVVQIGNERFIAEVDPPRWGIWQHTSRHLFNLRHRAPAGASPDRTRNLIEGFSGASPDTPEEPKAFTPQQVGAAWAVKAYLDATEPTDDVFPEVIASLPPRRKCRRVANLVAALNQGARVDMSLFLPHALECDDCSTWIGEQGEPAPVVPDADREEPSSEQQCSGCGGTNTTYQSFSGGREYYCRDCEDTFPYPEGEAPRRLQMLADGKYDELRQEMHEHLDSLPAPVVAVGDPEERPKCDRCGHTAWAHGNQSGYPVSTDPCHAEMSDHMGAHECPCTGYATPVVAIGDVIRCQNCGSQSRSISRGCSQCGYGKPEMFTAPPPVVQPVAPEPTALLKLAESWEVYAKEQERITGMIGHYVARTARDCARDLRQMVAQPVEYVGEVTARIVADTSRTPAPVQPGAAASHSYEPDESITGTEWKVGDRVEWREGGEGQLRTGTLKGWSESNGLGFVYIDPLYTNTIQLSHLRPAISTGTPEPEEGKRDA